MYTSSDFMTMFLILANKSKDLPQKIIKTFKTERRIPAKVNASKTEVKRIFTRRTVILRESTNTSPWGRKNWTLTTVSASVWKYMENVIILT